MREKIIELLECTYGEVADRDYDCYGECKTCQAENLISNGVGFLPKWIPVSERLPKMQTFTSNDPNDFWEYECSEMVLAYTDKGVRMVECGRDEHGMFWDEEGGTSHRNVTHWMPLPEPPKGE